MNNFFFLSFSRTVLSVLLSAHVERGKNVLYAHLGFDWEKTNIPGNSYLLLLLTATTLSCYLVYKLFLPRKKLMNLSLSFYPNKNQSHGYKVNIWIMDIFRSASLLIQLSFVLAWYHQNLGIFWDVCHFQKFFRQKMYPTPVKSRFKNTMGNHFFFYLFFFKY